MGALQLEGTPDNVTLAFSSSLSRVAAARRGELAAKAAKDMAQGFGPVEAAPNAYAKGASLASASDGLNKIEEQTGGATVTKPVPQVFPENRFDVWTEIYATHSKSGSSKADVWMGYLGAHYFVTSNLLVGALAQIDVVDESNGSSTTNGTGWMVGPYIAGRFPGQHLFYEARAAWGQSNNNISPTGGSKDKFKTERWLISGKVSGNYVIGSLDQMTKVTLNPFIRASYFEERQEAYTDSNSNQIDAQTISIGEVQFGPKLKLSKELANGVQFNPFVSVSGVWNFGISGDANDANLEDGDIRARLDGGVSFVTPQDWILSLASYYDGIGNDDYESYGGKVRATIPLN